MQITVLGAHNVETRDVRCMSILIDGVLALDAGGLTSSLSIAEQKRLRAVLITHHHYDHVRDVPALGMNLLLNGASTRIFCTPAAREALEKNLLNGDIYPKFFERPPDNPTFKLTVVEPLREELVEGYSVLPVPVNHAIPAIGYQVSAPGDGAVFYTGDTGRRLSDCWKWVSPQVLMVELTTPGRLESVADRTGHLTAALLKQELLAFRELKGYLPRVIAVHMNPYLEDEIAAEAGQAARDLGVPITLAREGMQLEL